ncbi:Bug family tripartite tricarboxylate transporter substrate binding protein [Brucella pituitosa]|uniref:Bug family tripartite tricarboxylate transporter substrate binding protein n=1 Tax=Brucella pituitosa TaxID=571256 RepID=UPI003C75B5A0
MNFLKPATAALIGIMALAGNVVAAETYPSKSIKMVVPFPPGGTSDFVGRVVAEQLGRELGQSIIVENLPGAAGVIGTVNIAQAEADGYSLLLTSSDVTIVPSVQKKPAFDPVKDFAPVSLLLRYSHYLVANSELPAKTIADVIALAKAEPETIYYASGGIGGSNHMAGERFQHFAGVKLTHVPYNGNGPAITDLVADRVQLLWTSLAPVRGFVDSGQLKLIGITSSKRSPGTPDVPTFDESGLPGYQLNNWYGVLAPKGTPDEIVMKLNATFTQVMANPEVQAKLASIGAEPASDTPAEFGQLIAEELKNWRKVAEDAGVATP